VKYYIVNFVKGVCAFLWGLRFSKRLMMSKKVKNDCP
jgi:hypothetical protein